jgi:hypothetical protein
MTAMPTKTTSVAKKFEADIPIADAARRGDGVGARQRKWHLRAWGVRGRARIGRFRRAAFNRMNRAAE